MTKRLVCLCMLLIPGLPLLAQRKAALSTSQTQTSPYLEPIAAGAYCEYVRSVADSQAAPLLAPVVFGTVGNSTAELLPSNLSDSTGVANRSRFLTGASYSFGNLQRAFALKRVARADCDQYKVTAGLETFILDNNEAFTSQALEARARVLREALPHSDEILSRTGKSVEAHSATAQEQHGMQLRRDELLQILEQTDSDMGKATKSESLAMLSLQELLKKEVELRSRHEIEEGNRRKAGAWDISVRSGYQRILNGPQTTPYFGTATLSFDLGRLWQSKPERRGAEAYRRWVDEDPIGPSARTYTLLQHFRSIQKAEAQRLRETKALLEDLEQRLESVRQVTDRRAESYADYVWFDYIKIKAEHAYLTAHLKDLSVVTGDFQQ